MIFTCAADLTKPIRQVPVCLAAPDIHLNHVQINYTSISGDLSRSSWAGALAPVWMDSRPGWGASGQQRPHTRSSVAQQQSGAGRGVGGQELGCLAAAATYYQPTSHAPGAGIFEELGPSPSTGLGRDLLHRCLLVSDSLTLEDLMERTRNQDAPSSGTGSATGQVSSGQL